jgi:putative hemolysin
MDVVVLLILILVAGTLNMCEIAVVSSRRARLQQWADEGRAGAARALALAEEPGQFMSSIQIGVTFIGILVGAVGEATLSARLAAGLSTVPWIESYSHALALGVVVAAIALVTLVLGELVPKRIALHHPEGLASAMAPALDILTSSMLPLVRVLNVVTEFFLRLVGAKPPSEPPVTEEEINVLMEQGAEAGVFEQHEQAMVSRVFRMDEERIWMAMTPRVDIVYFDLDEPFEVNRRKLLASGHSRFPVCHGGLDNVVGILRAKTLLDDALQGKPMDLASDAATPLYVPGTLTVTELLETFKKQRQHIALVIDEYGEVQGVVTINDVMERLVGDIATVAESTEPDIVARDDGSWLVDGDVGIGRFRELMGIEEELPDESTESYRTLGGFAMMQLGRVPHVGDHFETHGLRLEVVDMDRNRVDKLLIARVSGDARPGHRAE